MKAVTMKDIANVMNVSIVTVSKALAGKSGVSEEMREKIIRKSKEMGYIYTGVVSTQDDMQGNIGIIVADRFFKDNSFYSSMYRSIILECSEVGISSLLEIIKPEDEEKGVLPNFLVAKKCDGIIFMGETNSNYINEVSKTNIPYLLLDFYHENNKEDSIISDGLEGAYQLTSYLISQGHRRIGFVGTVLATSSILDRYLGYYKALLKNNISVNEDWILPDRGKDGRFIDIVLPQDMPTAFVCNCDETAYSLLIKLKSLGYEVPDDISIVGFDDFRFATLAEPALTTYRVNVASMGKAAVIRLLNKINQGAYTQGCSIISGEIVFRDSTRPNLAK